jgi:hypothetical protein
MAGLVDQVMYELVSHLDAEVLQHELQLTGSHSAISVSVQQSKRCPQVCDTREQEDCVFSFCSSLLLLSPAFCSYIIFV